MGSGCRAQSRLACLVGHLAVAPALVLALCGPAAAELPSCFEGPGEAAVVAEAIDGDTVHLEDGTVVRLAGVAAPRRPLTVADDRSWPPADAARRALHDLVAGRTVTLVETGSGTDRHGRLHARLVLSGGAWVEAELAAAGHVRALWLPDESACFGALMAAERTAREAARGLWASPEYAVLSADDPSLRSRNGLYELVEGRVLSVGRGSYMIFLDFGSDIRRDFTAMVPPDIAERLADAGMPPESFAGRRVRVRGIVEESGGPAIRLNDPAELELID